MPSFTGSGTISITGCTKYKLYLYSNYKYKPGDVLWYEPKARKGKLEKIVIKKVKIVSNYQTAGQMRFIYEDTLNSLYNEWDLISEYDALLLARSYYENQIFLTLSSNLNCSN